MKKLLFLGLAIALFGSCSDDDGSSTGPGSTGAINTGELVGRWYNETLMLNGHTVPYDDHEPCGKDYIEFTADGIIKSGDVYNCDGNTPQTDEYMVGTYTLSGNEITTDSNGQIKVSIIKKLTSTEFHVSYEEDWNEDGEAEIITETFTRQ